MTRRISLCAGMAAIALLAAAPAGAASITVDFVQKFTASDGAAGNGFGGSVALSGTNALVGANGVRAAYLYDTTTGAETRITTTNGSAADVFGRSVALDGSAALIGAFGDTTATGAAHLVDTGSGTQTKLTASDGAALEQFGFSVALDGTTALIGADLAEDNGSAVGAAYVIDTVTGAETKLLASDGAAFDRFGTAVAIDGATALVGASVHDNFIGAAYLYDITTGAETKLLASDGAAFDLFGGAVALDGTTALVGALGAGGGAAYLIDTVTGAETKLVAPDGFTGAEFGSSVAIEGNIAVIGARGDDDNGSGSGSAYVFDTLTGMLIQKIVAPDGAERAEFGISVAISGGLIMVGASDAFFPREGAAYLFEINTVDAAVPLPAPLALLLGGIGALGFVARRRG